MKKFLFKKFILDIEERVDIISSKNFANIILGIGNVRFVKEFITWKEIYTAEKVTYLITHAIDLQLIAIKNMKV